MRMNKQEQRAMANTVIAVASSDAHQIQMAVMRHEHDAMIVAWIGDKEFHTGEWPIGILLRPSKKTRFHALENQDGLLFFKELKDEFVRFFVVREHDPEDVLMSVMLPQSALM